MHNLPAKIARIEALCKDIFEEKINLKGNFRFYPREPKMPDCQVVALWLCALCEGIQSENHLYHRLSLEHPALFALMPCRQRFNQRLKNLRLYIDALSCRMADFILDPSEDILIDSAKFPLCRFGRAPRLKICREQGDLMPSFGYSATDKGKYFGFKLHMTCSESGVVTNFLLTPARVMDHRCVKELTSCFSKPKVVLGDKGYLSRPLQLDLFENHQIKLETPLRANQREVCQWSPSQTRKRLRIETLFSQLIDQFALRVNYAKTVRGLLTRISTKILALTTLQFFNYVEGLPIAQIKNSFAFQ
jgi:hypothetical protein